MSEIFNCENGSPCSCCHALKRTTQDVGYLDRENKRLQGIIDSQLVTTGTQETITTLRAQLAAEKERVGELEVELGNLNTLIEFYKPSFETAMGVTLGDIIKGVEAVKQLAQRDAEIARLRENICIDCKYTIDLLEEFPEMRKEAGE